MANYLTRDDVYNYGEDLINFTQRAAAQYVAPHLQNLERICDGKWRSRGALASTRTSPQQCQTTWGSTTARAGSNGCPKSIR
jgi:hypothetical protein